MYIADTLSCAALPVKGIEDIDVLSKEIICQVNNLPVNENNFNLFFRKQSHI